jgi:uncharacterized membrane protein
MSTPLQLVAEVAVPACAATTALCAGVYGAFSVIVMPALRHLPVPAAIAAMQRLDAAAVRPPFMTVFFGAAITAAVTDGAAILDPATVRPLAVVGATASLAAFALTIAFHVPRNRRIQALAPSAPDAAAAWARLSHAWIGGNHVRAVLAAVGAALLAI